jgi:hypothetical protein
MRRGVGQRDATAPTEHIVDGAALERNAIFRQSDHSSNRAEIFGRHTGHASKPCQRHVPRQTARRSDDQNAARLDLPLAPCLAIVKAMVVVVMVIMIMMLMSMIVIVTTAMRARALRIATRGRRDAPIDNALPGAQRHSTPAIRAAAQAAP